MRRLLSIVALALLAATGLTAQVDEYQVKAFFLYNFARYVEWPSQALGPGKDPLVICVLGHDPFGAALQQAISGKAIDGRSLVVHELHDLRPGCNCHILFVGASERKLSQAAVAALKASGILTVGETPEFLKDGGVINFKLEDGKVRFEINVAAADQQGLRISSKLLSLAEVVRR